MRLSCAPQSFRRCQDREIGIGTSEMPAQQRLHAPPRAGVDVEQTAAIVLQSTDRATQISHRAPDIAPHAEIGSATGQVIRLASATDATIMAWAPTSRVHGNSTEVRRHMRNNSAQARRQTS